MFRLFSSGSLMPSLKTRLCSPFPLLRNVCRSPSSIPIGSRLLCHLRLSSRPSIVTTRSFHGGYRRSSSSYSDKVSAEFLIYGLIGVNSLVFLSWLYAKSLAESKGDLSALIFMHNNFVVGIPQVLGIGHFWTPLTAAFSHYDLWHFGINMFVLHSFGPTVVDLVGKRQFLPLYLGMAIFSSLVSLGAQMASFNPSQRSNAPRGSLGASGAIYGATTLFALTFPRAPIAIFGIIPAPAGLAIGGFMAWDLYRTYHGTGGSTDTAGHLGGAAAGALYWFLRIRLGR